MSLADRIICVTSCRDPRLRYATFATLPSGLVVKSRYGPSQVAETTQDTVELYIFYGIPLSYMEELHD